MKNMTLLDAEVALALFEDIRPSAAVRHQITAQENIDLRSLFEGGFEAVKAHVQSFAKEDVTCFAMEQSTVAVFRQALEGNPLGTKTVNQDRDTLQALAERDAYGWIPAFNDCLYTACAMDDAQQKKCSRKQKT